MSSLDLATLTMKQAIAGLDAKAFSSFELIRESLRLARATEPDLHAFVEVYEKDALEHALVADRARSYHRQRRPLLGLPFGVKDIFDIAGKPTRCNSAIRKDAGVAHRDAEVVHRVRRDGGNFLGKTVTQEFAAGVVSAPCRNPWDLDRIPGGSSGGTAASIAIGTTVAGFGSDTGGSIRIPAALCGITGLKPTFGQLPTHRVYPLSGSLDTVGPLARTVWDAMAMYLSMADRTAEIDTLDTVLAEVEGNAPLTGRRIGIIPSGYFVDRVDPGVQGAFEEAAGVLRTLGAEIVEVSWDDAYPAQAVATLLSRVESGAIHHDHLRTQPELIGDDVRTRFEVGAILSGDLYLRTQTARRAIRDSIARVYREHDLTAIVVPSTARTATLADEPTVTYEDGTTATVGGEMTRLTMPWNTTGQPVLSVPCGFADELPVGLSIVGRPHDETGICQIGHAYERVTNWFAEGVSRA